VQAGEDRRVALGAGLGAWEVLRAPLIGLVGGRAIRVGFLAAHPARGVALLDIAPAFTPKAVATLRCRLEMEGFATPHPDTLPVAYCRLDPADLPRLPRLLDAALPVRSELRAAGDWVPRLAALVGSAAAPTPGPRRHRLLLAAGAALLVLLGLGLMLSA
jgi:hypothetical protein